MGYEELKLAGYDQFAPTDETPAVNVRVFVQQICVPSANRTYSPFALLPRSIIAPDGMPLA